MCCRGLNMGSKRTRSFNCFPLLRCLNTTEVIFWFKGFPWALERILGCVSKCLEAENMLFIVWSWKLGRNVLILFDSFLAVVFCSYWFCIWIGIGPEINLMIHCWFDPSFPFDSTCSFIFPFSFTLLLLSVGEFSTAIVESALYIWFPSFYVYVWLFTKGRTHCRCVMYE